MKFFSILKKFRPDQTEFMNSTRRDGILSRFFFFGERNKICRNLWMVSTNSIMYFNPKSIKIHNVVMAKSFYILYKRNIGIHHEGGRRYEACFFNPTD